MEAKEMGEKMEKLELWINGEHYCELEGEGEAYGNGYCKIPLDEARNLILCEGDVLEVQRVATED